MALFEDKSEKKSLIITVVINTALILALFFYGLTYMDPPEESGIAINFGDSDIGAGEEQPVEPVESEPVEEAVEEEIEEAEPAVEEESSDEEETEETVTQETEEAPVINKEEEKEKTKEEKDEESEEKEEAEEDPQPEKSTSDALKNVLAGEEQQGKTSEGEGDDDQGGDKGDPSGDPDADSYYGQGEGLDGDGNYRLGGRKALNKEKIQQDCNESGTVVVRIRVNRQGEVVKAEPGVKGTTNASSCLLEPAKKAAESTIFNTDADAPSTQTGVIIYEFKLSE